MRTALIIASLLWSWSCWATSGERVLIDSITIVGNERTQDRIILREMPLQPGDTVLLDLLQQEIERCEYTIMNTGLFNRAKITYLAWEGSSNRVHLLVTVEENWYLYPIPLFELADRNFNVWWVDQNRSLERTNIGIDFAHINLTGRKDRLKASIKYGYTRRYALSYNLPYINKAQTLGLSANASLVRNRETNHRTEAGKQAFYRDEDGYVYERFSGGLGLAYRPRIQGFHRLTLEYLQLRTAEAIALDLNPDFFLEGRQRQRYFRLSYNFFYENRDVAPYPWSGSFVQGSAVKSGLGIFGERSGLTLNSAYGRYLPIGKRWSMGLEARAKLSLIRSPQPYQENRGLGFGAYSMRGWEYYVVDGLDAVLGKSSLKFRFWEHRFNFGKLMPIGALRQMPVRLHLAFNNDLGYVNSPHNRLSNPHSNRLLWGGGIGLDIVLYYDKVIQIQYSFNDLMEKGLFLHLSMNI